MVKKPGLTPINGSSGEPPSPDWVERYADLKDVVIAQESWRRIVNEMKESETLSVANGAQMMRLVDAYILYERACRHLFDPDGGAILQAKKSQSPMYNVWLGVMKDATNISTMLERELGLSPRGRATAEKKQRKVASTKAAAFLEQVGKI
jgi:P27 family predicted phage terminase small subunit